MHAQPEPLWSTQGKHASIPCIPVPCCHGVPCIFLTVLLSYAAVSLPHDHGEKPCTPKTHLPPQSKAPEAG